MDTAPFRAALSQRLARNEKVTARLRHASGMPDDWPERASLLADEDVLDGLDQGERVEIVAIRDALGRIAAGTYGACSSCGEPIGEGRLRAVPTATKCVDCME
jgi:RNA polymerase-binding transcription factor DksA